MDIVSVWQPFDIKLQFFIPLDHCIGEGTAHSFYLSGCLSLRAIMTMRCENAVKRSLCLNKNLFGPTHTKELSFCQ